MRHQTRCLLPLMVLLLVSLGGCPGDMGLGPSTDPPQPVSTPAPDLFMPPTPTLDGGTAAPAEDGSPTAVEDGGTAGVDSMASDTLAADPTVPTSSAGQPCPCDGNAICINNVCRAVCDPPTGACGVTSNCPADHACLPTSQAGLFVCMPAVQPGQACNQTAYCPVDHVCGSGDLTNYRGLPICVGAGTPCGAGGTCLAAPNGCTFCSAI